MKSSRLFLNLCFSDEEKAMQKWWKNVIFRSKNQPETMTTPNPTKNISRHASPHHLLGNKCVFYPFLQPGCARLGLRNDVREVCGRCAGGVREMCGRWPGAPNAPLIFAGSQNRPDWRPDGSREVPGHLQGTLQDDFVTDFRYTFYFNLRWKFQEKN